MLPVRSKNSTSRRMGSLQARGPGGMSVHSFFMEIMRSVCVFTDLRDLFPQSYKIAKNGGLVDGGTQQGCRMIGGHEQRAAFVEKFPVIAGNGEVRADHLLCGDAAEADDDLGAQKLK